MAGACECNGSKWGGYKKIKVSKRVLKKMGNTTVKWPEDEEKDSCGPKEAR